jgi:SagB-type dehydrogenase family enzyme
VLILTARFGAALPGFRRIGYHLLLREAGVHMATSYLVATHLDLAACAIGAWEERRLNDWLALDGIHEGVVGLFALGVSAAAAVKGRSSL